MIPAWRSSQPAYDTNPTPQPTPASTSEMCANRDCTHINEWAEGEPPPAMIWRSQGCQRAWTVQHMTPLNECAARVDRPTTRSEPAPWSWLPDPTERSIAEVTWRGDRAS